MGEPQRLTGLDDSKDKVDFNISHDDELVVFAVESSSPTISDRRAMVQPVVGVDCMRLDRDADELQALDEVLMAQVSPPRAQQNKVSALTRWLTLPCHALFLALVKAHRKRTGRRPVWTDA